MSKGKMRYKSPFLARQLSVFFTPVKYEVVKIAHSSFKVVLRTIKHIMIYPYPGPSSEAIALLQQFDIKDEHVLQMGEQRAREVHVVKGGN
jgi:hypothetical protein